MKKYTRHDTGIKLFGEKLREIRQSRELTQVQLAMASGLELSQISRIERGVINTSISQLFQIAEALGVHPKALFDFDWKQEA